MIIVVIGGHGLIGSKVVNLLRESCLDVVSASRTEGVNTFTGEGLDEALEDAEIVVDVTKSPSFGDKAALEFYETSGRNILTAEQRAGVTHHIALSIVGINKLQQGGYFRAKLAQEKLIRQSAVPYTILRSTQFFEFLPVIADTCTIGERVFLPPVLAQPIAAADVAATLADIALSTAANDILEVAGQERVNLVERVKRFLSYTDDARTVVADENALYFGAKLSGSSLVPSENAQLGSLSFEAWLSQFKVKA